MHRPTVALIAVVLLAIGFFTSSSDSQGLSQACLRIGMIMAILWFAQPQLQNLPGWLVATTVVILLVAARWPRLLVIAIPIAAILWLLGPRAPRPGPKAGTPRA
jgi:hypothetical protein